jgi:hypothetical protein
MFARSAMARAASAETSVQGYLDRVERRVRDLTDELGSLRDLLASGALELTHWQSYRLAVTLMRVDEASAALVMDQAARDERAEASGDPLAGQLPAFPDLEP